MNLLLAFNSTLAIVIFMASTLCAIGWICFRLLKLVARLLAPLVKDEERPAARPRSQPGLAQAAGSKAAE